MKNDFDFIQEKILPEYSIGLKEILDYKYVTNDPDMWAHYFLSNDKQYVLVEHDYFLNINIPDENGEITELCRKLGIKKDKLKLIKPTKEQLHTEHNHYGLGIDGFNPVIDKETGMHYKNPHGLKKNVVYTLFIIEK